MTCLRSPRCDTGQLGFKSGLSAPRAGASDQRPKVRKQWCMEAGSDRRPSDWDSGTATAEVMPSGQNFQFPRRTSAQTPKQQLRSQRLATARAEGRAEGRTVARTQNSMD